MELMHGMIKKIKAEGDPSVFFQQPEMYYRTKVFSYFFFIKKLQLSKCRCSSIIIRVEPLHRLMQMMVLDSKS